MSSAPSNLVEGFSRRKRMYIHHKVRNLVNNVDLNHKFWYPPAQAVTLLRQISSFLRSLLVRSYYQSWVSSWELLPRTEQEVLSPSFHHSIIAQNHVFQIISLKLVVCRILAHYPVFIMPDLVALRIRGPNFVGVTPSDPSRAFQNYLKKPC